MEDPAQQLVDVDAMGDGDGTGDPDAGLFKVSFRDFLELREQKYTSEEFTAAACKWCATHAYAPDARVVEASLGLTQCRHSYTLFLDGTRRLLLFPRHGTGNSVGVFLEALPDANGVLAPRKCSFTIAVLGTGEPTLKTAQHVFSSDANDWCARGCGALGSKAWSSLSIDSCYVVPQGVFAAPVPRRPAEWRVLGEQLPPNPGGCAHL